MADLGISETQFVFTYLHHYLNLSKRKNTKFILPSLLQEGDPSSPYAGADIVIRGHLYLQFKLSDYLDTRAATEIRDNKLKDNYRPYFRFEIKNAPTQGGIGQYDILLNRHKASKSNIVKYISPWFDTSMYSHSPLGRKNWWYDAFLANNPSTALFAFVTEVKIQEIIKSGVIINNTNEHRVCYNSNAVIKKQKVYVFSDEGKIKMIKGVSEYDINKKDFTFYQNKGNSIETELAQLSQLTGFFSNDKDRLSEMQLYLIKPLNIFWIPFGIRTDK